MLWRWVLLCIMMGGGLCGWAWPKVMANYSIGFNASLAFSTEAANKHHVLGTKQGKICHVLMDELNATITQLTTPTTVYIQSVSMAGTGDGKALFVAALGNYSGSKSGLYFTEIKDYGATWTELAMLSTDDLNVRDSRYSILLIEQTGRLFLFYSYRESSSAKLATIAFMTRPKGSSIWDMERQLGKYINASSVHAMHMYNGTTLILAVTWIANENIYYTKSENMGITWTAPRKLMPGTNQQLINTRLTQYSIFKNGYKPLAMRWSPDLGLTWSKTVELIYHPYWEQVPSVAVCNTYNGYEKVVVGISDLTDSRWIEVAIIDSLEQSVSMEQLPVSCKTSPISIFVTCGKWTDSYTLDLYAYIQYYNETHFVKGSLLTAANA